VISQLVRAIAIAGATLGGLGLLALLACTNAARRETSSLAAAVDRYRHASATEDKESLASAVSSVGCTDARVCDAKQACVAAIDPTTRALALKDEVTRRLADIEQKRLASDSPEAQALPAKLDEAERLLREGRTHMAACDAKLATLQVATGG
jgi:hypothetical protein